MVETIVSYHADGYAMAFALGAWHAAWHDRERGYSGVLLRIMAIGWALAASVAAVAEATK